MKKMPAEEAMHAVLDALPQMLEDVIAQAFKRGKQDHVTNDCLVQKERDVLRRQRDFYAQKVADARSWWLAQFTDAGSPYYHHPVARVSADALWDILERRSWTPPSTQQIEQGIAEGKRLGDYIAKEARRVSSEEERLSYKEDVACSSRAPGTSLSEAIRKAEARNSEPPTRPVSFSGCNASAQQSSPLNGDEGERCEPNSPPKLK